MLTESFVLAFPGFRTGAGVWLRENSKRFVFEKDSDMLTKSFALCFPGFKRSYQGAVRYGHFYVVVKKIGSLLLGCRDSEKVPH